MLYRIVVKTPDCYSSFSFEIKFSDGTFLSFLGKSGNRLGYIQIKTKKNTESLALKALSTTLFSLMYLFFCKGSFQILETYGGSGFGPHPNVFGEHNDYLFENLEIEKESDIFKLKNLNNFFNFETFTQSLFDNINSKRDILYFSEMVLLYGEFLDRRTSADKNYLAGFRLLETLACWEGLKHQNVCNLGEKLSCIEKRKIRKAIGQWSDLRNNILAHFSIRPYIWRAFDKNISNIFTNENIDFEKNIQRGTKNYDSFDLLNYPESDLDDCFLRYLISKKLNVLYYEGYFRSELVLPDEKTIALAIYNHMRESEKITELIDDSDINLG